MRPMTAWYGPLPRAVNVHRRGAMVDPARGPLRGARMRQFIFERNRARFHAQFGDWFAGQAPPGEGSDYRHPAPRSWPRRSPRCPTR